MKILVIINVDSITMGELGLKYFAFCKY